MVQIWQNLPLQIDPVAFSIGPLAVRWYGLMYLVAFATVYFLAKRKIQHDNTQKSPKTSKQKVDHLEALCTWAIVGILVGGRIGYFILYQTATFFTAPWQAVWPFASDGTFVGLAGMSFHGGLVGGILAGLYYMYKHKLQLQEWSQIIVPYIPLAYTWGRLGNWLNGELWGRTTNSMFGQYFATDSEQLLRHPSQLYEAALEGICVYLLLQVGQKFRLIKNNLLTAFVVLYSIARFFVEYFREPDAHLGIGTLGFTRGQWLAVASIIIAILCNLIWQGYQHRSKQDKQKKTK